MVWCSLLLKLLLQVLLPTLALAAQIRPDLLDADDLKLSQTISRQHLRQGSDGAAAHSGSAAPGKLKIYTYWDYGAHPPLLVQRNVESWLAHAPTGTEVVFVNESNFRTLIPDTPEELFRLPYAACKSDVVRAAVLYHQGGLYMDTDILCMGPLSRVLEKLDKGWDVVAYSDGDHESGRCNNGAFTSNFMAARKGNLFSRTWWENVRAKLTRTCGEGEYAKEKVCCHEAFNDANRTHERMCHVPWGHLEWLKDPNSDADLRNPLTSGDQERQPQSRVGPEAAVVQAAVARGNAPATALAPSARLFCLSGSEGLAPHLNGEIYWQKWDAKANATSTEEAPAELYDTRFQCRELERGDLECDRGTWGIGTRLFPNFFGRTAYHLFFSTRGPQSNPYSDTLIGELYRRSFARAATAAYS